MIERVVAALCGLGLAATLGAAPPCAGPACTGTLVLIGTHTGGVGQGIFAARLNPANGALTSLGLAAEVERPTWLAVDPNRPVLYSVSETGNDGKSPGSVYSLSIDRGTGRLAILSRTASGGGGATHLAYEARLGTVFIANFGGGQVSAIPVGADGHLGTVASVQQNRGSGPNKRQAGPHAHGVTVDPSGHYLLSPDLGADKLFVYRWDAATKTLMPARTPSVAFPPGSGPRHLVFSPDGRFAFLNTELTGEVYAFRWNATKGELEQVARLALDAPDFAGTRSAAELAVSPNGRILYVSNRGANLLQVFAIDRRSGGLAEIQRIASGGDVPWSFAIDPSGRWLLVANEASSTLAEFAVDRATGRLSATANKLDVLKPVAIAYSR